MTDEAIHPDHILIALEKVSGSDFEQFVNAFFPALIGVSFVPLGGMGDGGADALLDLGGTWTDGGPGIFYQSSTQKTDYENKISRTAKRLLEVGRDPTTLYYITSIPIKMVDAKERELSKKLNLTIRLYDRAYIASHINDNLQTRGAFRNFLLHYLDYLKPLGTARIVAPSQHVQSPAVFVFLQQEVERRSGQTNLSTAIIDSLIMWALEETDPDRGKFLNKSQIVDKIKASLPFTAHLVDSLIDRRLLVLSKKSNPTGREIRHHRKQDLYCLPYETRKKVQEDNTLDEALRIKVQNQFEERIS